ncbi:MAG: hypothetical protein ACLPH3_20990 [Terracidiphilus sp.]
MTRARRERAKYHFKVSEYGDGTCFISTETLGADVPLLAHAHAHLSFDLPEGASLEKAHEIAEFLNRNLAGVAVTVFEPEFQNEVRRDLKPR